MIVARSGINASVCTAVYFEKTLVNIEIHSGSVL